MQREWFSGRIHPEVMKWLVEKKQLLKLKSVSAVIEWMAKFMESDRFAQLEVGKYERNEETKNDNGK